MNDHFGILLSCFVLVIHCTETFLWRPSSLARFSRALHCVIRTLRKHYFATYLDRLCVHVCLLSLIEVCRNVNVHKFAHIYFNKLTWIRSNIFFIGNLVVKFPGVCIYGVRCWKLPKQQNLGKQHIITIFYIRTKLAWMLYGYFFLNQNVNCIPSNMHTVSALLCIVIRYWSNFLTSVDTLHWDSSYYRSGSEL